MRKISNTVDYFPHYCKHKDTLEIVDSLYGNDGVALWWRLLERLGDTENHCLDFADDMRWLKFVSDCHVTPERADEILNLFSRLKSIDPILWQKRLIWSENFVNGLSDVYAKRGREKPLKPFLVERTPLFPPVMSKLTPAIPQSKVKDSKVKDSKVKDSKEESGASKDQTPPVTPETAPKEYSKIVKDLCERLINLIKKDDLKFKVKNINAWYSEMDKLMRLDNREEKEIGEVIDSCKADSFWSANILSTSKLRQKYPQLLANMKRGSNNGGAKNSPSNDPRQAWRAREDINQFDNIKTTIIHSGEKIGNDDVI